MNVLDTNMSVMNQWYKLYIAMKVLEITVWRECHELCIAMKVLDITYPDPNTDPQVDQAHLVSHPPIPYWF